MNVKYKVVKQSDRKHLTIRLTFDTPQGVKKKVQSSRQPDTPTGRKKANAMAAMLAEKIASEGTGSIDHRDTLFRDYARAERIESKQIKDSTKRGYLGIFEYGVYPYWINKKIRDLGDITEIRAFDHALIKKGKKRQTRNCYMVVLRIFVQDLFEKKKIIVANPLNGYRLESDLAKIDVSKESERSEKAPLNEEELQAYMDCANRMYPLPSPWGVMLQLMPLTGTRRGELFGLAWKDFMDSDEPELRIRRSWDVKNGFTTTKSPKAVRELKDPFLRPTAIQLLRKWKLACKKTGPNDRIFPFDIYGLYPKHQLILKEMRKEGYGVEPFRLHDQRAVFASILARRQIPPKTLQRLLGHEDFSTTMDISMPDSQTTTQRGSQGFWWDSANDFRKGAARVPLWVPLGHFGVYPEPANTATY